MDKNKLKKGTDEIEFVLCIIILAVMLFAASWNVICRYVLSHSQNWADELCRFGLIWASFLSMSAAVTSGNHLYVDLLTGINAKHPRFALFIQAISSIIWIGIGLFLAYWGWASVKRVTEMTQTLGFSMKVVYFSIPLGCVLMVIRIIQKFVLQIRSLKKEDEEGGK